MSASDTQHTPGPWRVDPDHPLCVEANDGNVCLVNLARASRADAELIARAPDLELECAALRKALEEIQSLKPVNMACDYWSTEYGLKPDDVFDICETALRSHPASTTEMGEK